jgi:hypothetical protein
MASKPSKLRAMQPARDLFSYRKHWAHRFGPAPFLPMSRAEMDELGWDSCDVILVTGDAYVDLPSFGMAIVGRVLEAQGFRVGIIAQPDWHSTRDFMKFGRPNLFFGVTGGNMDSMVNRYTADRRIRSDDAYTPHGVAGARPDRCVIVYSQRVREAYKDVPVVIGGIEASLRRIAHFDYWSEKVRRSVLLDAKADLLVYGNAERQICEIAHRLAAGTPISEIHDLRGTAFVRRETPEGWTEIDSTSVDEPGRLNPPVDPYAIRPAHAAASPRPSAPAREDAVNPSMGAPGAASMPRTASRIDPEDRAAAAVGDACAGAAPLFTGSAAYGSTGGFSAPGTSSVVESISVQPSGLALRANAVPRRSRIWSIGVPAASRCAISQICRSALPKTSRSAFASSSTERRTFSDQ